MRIRWVLMTGIILLLVGCGTVRDITAITGGIQGWRTAKGLVNVEPVFNGKAAVRVDAKIFPRDEERAEEMNVAFQLNMEQKVAEILYETDIDLPVCRETCPPNTLLIQFRETGYDRFIERFSLRRTYRGDLFFIDQEFGQILERLEPSAPHDYRSLTGIILGFVSQRAMVDYARRGQMEVETGQTTEEEFQVRAEALLERLDAIEPVDRQYYDDLDPRHPWYDRFIG